MKVDKTKQVNYLEHMSDMLRCSHAVESINPPPTLDEVTLQDIDYLDEEIRKRKQLICGFHTEIREIEKLKEKLR